MVQRSKQTDGMIILVKAIETCSAAPSQWDGWDFEGRYWYMKYRSGRGFISRDYDEDNAEIWVSDGTGDSWIDLEGFCALLGIMWLPGAEPAWVVFEKPPALPGEIREVTT